MTERDERKIEEIAAVAREVYCRLMRGFIKRWRGHQSDYGQRPIARWDGGRAADGRTYRPVWPRLAAFVLDNGLDLVGLLETMFRLRDNSAPPTPLQCCSASALAAYRSLADVEAKRARKRGVDVIASELTLLESEVVLRSPRSRLGWSPEDILRSVLVDMGLSISPLVRLCVAHREGYADLTERYGQAALAQYLDGRALYDAALGLAIPEPVRRLADAAVRRTST